LRRRKSFNDCDVVIVNYNAGMLLADCVSSVFAAGGAKAIVVDNHSTDGSLEHLEHVIENEKLVVIRNGSNLGFAAACNIGAKASSAHHGVIVKSSVWQAVKRLSVLACQSLPHHLQI